MCVLLYSKRALLLGPHHVSLFSVIRTICLRFAHNCGPAQPWNSIGRDLWRERQKTKHRCCCPSGLVFRFKSVQLLHRYDCSHYSMCSAVPWIFNVSTLHFMYSWSRPQCERYQQYYECSDSSYMVHNQSSTHAHVYTASLAYSKRRQYCVCCWIDYSLFFVLLKNARPLLFEYFACRMITGGIDSLSKLRWRHFMFNSRKAIPYNGTVQTQGFRSKAVRFISYGQITSAKYMWICVLRSCTGQIINIDYW